MPGQGDVSLCVFCRRQPAADPWRPFCSERCRLQDLARWAEGSYRILGDPIDQGDDPDVDNERDAD